MAEPVIAVAGDQVIDFVADHPWDEVKKPCPLPPRRLARDAQRGIRIYIGLSVCHERKGIRAIRIDAELLSKRASLGQLHRNDAAITFAHEAAPNTDLKFVTSRCELSNQAMHSCLIAPSAITTAV